MQQRRLRNLLKPMVPLGTFKGDVPPCVARLAPCCFNALVPSLAPISPYGTIAGASFE